MPRLDINVGWILVLLIASSTAKGTTFNFTGSVSSANIGNYAAGSPIQGSLSFNANAPGLSQSNGTLTYLGAVTNFELGGIQLSGPITQNEIDVLSYSVSGYEDFFDATIGTASSTLEFFLNVTANTGTLGNGQLPTQPLPLAAFQNPATYSSTYVQLADFTNAYQYINADLTSIASAPVPEPASAGLILLGGLGLVMAIYDRRSSKPVA